ncbi:hypothetical protein NMY27_09800 [Cronobacter dublinensis subsp. beijingensis]|uniref:hypothetical protein n=1 Tax=Cronobacter dublinensis TaxID=413497 RepID=UPI0023DBC8A1|nr:hypothetical protein [Cronobacter dublinensis]WEP51451.1 hypothetical protein NMY27_09800 [Cronobacter dublinensis]
MMKQFSKRKLVEISLPHIKSEVSMDSDLISFQSLLTSKEAVSAAWWTMIFTAVASLCSLITGAVAIYAAILAKIELSSWKEHEKQLQLVRLKRSVFAYRQALESKIHLHADKEKINEEFSSKMQPLLSDIYHELVLAGLDYDGCLQTKLFDDLAQAHNLHRYGDVQWGVVFKKAVDLQKSINVNI